MNETEVSLTILKTLSQAVYSLEAHYQKESASLMNRGLP